MKFNATPPNISLTSPRPSRIAASAAHNAPPSAANANSTGTTSSPDESGVTLRATTVAKIARSVTCPSTPIFHSPAVNVSSSPLAHSKIGRAIMTTSERWAALPSVPSINWLTASAGSLLIETRISAIAPITTTSARTSVSVTWTNRERSAIILFAPDHAAKFGPRRARRVVDDSGPPAKEHGDTVTVFHDLVQLVRYDNNRCAVRPPIKHR